MPEIDELIRDRAKIHNIPYPVLKAQVEHESNGNPLAVRFERDYRWTWPPPANDGAPRYVTAIDHSVCNSATEEILQKCSFGLLQVMGAVARELGFRGPSLLELASDTGLALTYGCQLMAKKIKKYGKIEDALSAYNAGIATPANRKTYVLPILERAALVRE